MAITHALEKGNYVEVYDGNRKLFEKMINKHNGDRLIGFTGSSVTIKIGEYAETFDEKQNRISSQHIGR